jgi:hypothetical protein
MSQTRTATLTMALTFEGDDATKKRIEANLQEVVSHAFNTGMFTLADDMTVELDDVTVTVENTAEEAAQSAAELEELLNSIEPD